MDKLYIPVYQSSWDAFRSNIGVYRSLEEAERAALDMFEDASVIVEVYEEKDGKIRMIRQGTFDDMRDEEHDDEDIFCSCCENLGEEEDND